MKELLKRSLSGLLFILLLVFSLFNEYSAIFIFFVFGLISLIEFNKLIKLKSIIPYIIFFVLYSTITTWEHVFKTNNGFDEIVQILLVLTIFVELFLIRDLSSNRLIPLFNRKRFLLTTFYLSNSFLFLILIAKFDGIYNAKMLLGVFILIWVNDTFAYLVGKNFGRQKLFEKISPKKTVEGFLGGLLFSCIASYFITTFAGNLSFTHWLILSIIMCVFGTIGDLVESKFKRQAQVKDSGTIMPGHGGLLDRLDSIIFAAPFIYLFLRIIYYVS